MESRLLKLEHDVEVLSSENRRLKSENIKLKMKNTEQDKGIEILRNGNKQLHELIETRLLLQNTPTEGVAFYAYINSLKSELPAKHVMVYDTVITNHGNSYHKDDGIFIVPQNGIYVFSWSVAVQDGEWAHAEIVLNGSPFGSVMADTSAVGASDGGLSTGIAIKEFEDHEFASAGVVNEHCFLLLLRLTLI
ncbi:heavy metal-binding protein HIP-like [Saccostrea cucullata]|uniref:heavy metal-binding protein HIP-like n=1 Tax=Saccostrea cuccullata TaxID=36930 RepID=UPI002ED02016